LSIILNNFQIDNEEQRFLISFSFKAIHYHSSKSKYMILLIKFQY